MESPNSTNNKLKPNNNKRQRVDDGLDDPVNGHRASNPFEATLNFINEPVLMMKNSQFYAANAPFYKSFKTSASELEAANLSILFDAPAQHDSFMKTIAECEMQHKEATAKVVLKNNILASISFHPSDGVVSCIFRHIASQDSFLHGYPALPTHVHQNELNCKELCGRHIPFSWAIVELMPDRKELRFIFANQRWINEACVPLGVTDADQVWNHFMSEIFDHKGLLPENQRSLDKLYDATKQLNDEQSQTIEIELFTPDTEIKSFFIKYIGQSATHSRLFYMLQNDITANKKLQAEVADITQRCQLLKSFFDDSPLFMGMFEMLENDSTVKWLFWNNAVLRDWKHGVGFSNEILADSSRPEFPPKALPNMYVEEFKKCEALGGYYEWEHATGSNRHYKIITRKVGQHQFAYLCQDVTNSKRMEQELKNNQIHLERLVKERTRQLEEAVQVKTQFLATMSHEIRTPLSGVIGSVNLLADTLVSQEQLELIRITKLCGEQLLAVINDILDLSKMEENKMILEKAKFDPKQALESLELNALVAEAKGLELVTDFDQNVPELIIGDAVRLRQVVINLLSNAIKFSNAGKIVLSSKVNKMDGNFAIIQISVLDQGIGISPEAQTRLFQPFTQADSSMTRKYGGTGLGLSISKRLTHLMEGEMWIQSQEGIGSTFTFTIRAEVAKPADTIPLATQLTDCHVVLVDDGKSDGLVDVIQRKLRSWGFIADIIREPEMAPIAVETADNNTIVFVNDKYSLERMEQSLRKKSSARVVYMGYSKPQLLVWPAFYFLKKPIRDSKLKTLLQKTLVPLGSTPTTPYTPSPVVTEKSAVKEALRQLVHEKSVLIAEDNPLNQKVIRKVLEGMGFQTANLDIRENGKLAVDSFKANHFDLVLMDMMMPEMGGLEATQLIRQYERTSIFKRTEVGEPARVYRAPIVALTAKCLRRRS